MLQMKHERLSDFIKQCKEITTRDELKTMLESIFNDKDSLDEEEMIVACDLATRAYINHLYKKK